MTRWETLLILHEKKKKMGLKNNRSAFKISALHSSGTSHKFSGIPREVAFIWSCFMQIHFYWMQQSRDTISSFANMLASLQGSRVPRSQHMPHGAEAPLFSRWPLSSSTPWELYWLHTVFCKIHPAPTFSTQGDALEFTNLNGGPISLLGLGETRKQKREERRPPLQEHTLKSFSKFTKSQSQGDHYLSLLCTTTLGTMRYFEADLCIPVLELWKTWGVMSSCSDPWACPPWAECHRLSHVMI